MSSPAPRYRLSDRQRCSFLCLWDTVPSRTRRIGFALDATGWNITAIALTSTLTDYAEISSSSKLDYRECFLCPFEIQSSSRDPVNLLMSLPTKRNPLQIRRRHSRLLSRRCFYSVFHIPVVKPPRMRSERTERHSHHSRSQKSTVAENLGIAMPPALVKYLTPSTVVLFS